MKAMCSPRSLAASLFTVALFQCISNILPPPIYAQSVSLNTAQPKAIIATGDGLVFRLKHGRLIANEKRSGRRRWSFGHNLGAYSYALGVDNKRIAALPGLILSAKHQVFTLSDEGILYAVNAKNGRMLWHEDRSLLSIAHIPESAFCVYELDYQNGILLIWHSFGLIAFRGSDGKMLWCGSTGDNYALNAVITHDVAIVSYCSDPMFGNRYDAYDFRTGTHLWNIDGDMVSSREKTISFQSVWGDPSVPTDFKHYDYILDIYKGKVIFSETKDGTGRLLHSEGIRPE